MKLKCVSLSRHGGTLEKRATTGLIRQRIFREGGGWWGQGLVGHRTGLVSQ